MTSIRCIAAALALTMTSGCSMGAEWWIRHRLRDAGFSRAEADCAVEGVAGRLTRAELSEVRSALLVLGPMNMTGDIDALLAAIEPRLDREIHWVLAQHARACRAMPAGDRR